MIEKDGIIFEGEKQLLEYEERTSMARNNSPEYIRGYSEGYRDGFNKAYEELKRQFELINTARSVEIKVSADEFERIKNEGLSI